MKDGRLASVKAPFCGAATKKEKDLLVSCNGNGCYSQILFQGYAVYK
jgi:hypothetical protein